MAAEPCVHLVDSLLAAIVREDGESLVLHVGERPVVQGDDRRLGDRDGGDEEHPERKDIERSSVHYRCSPCRGVGLWVRDIGLGAILKHRGLRLLHCLSLGVWG